MRYTKLFTEVNVVIWSLSALAAGEKEPKRVVSSNAIAIAAKRDEHLDNYIVQRLHLSFSAADKAS